MKELNQKLAQIQTELKAKKSSYNSFGKYHFRKAEDILEAIKPFLLKQHLTDKEYNVLRLSYGLDCDKHNATQIADYLGIEGSSAYVRVSQLKRQAVNKLIENVDHSQVIDFL